MGGDRCCGLERDRQVVKWTEDGRGLAESRDRNGEKSLERHAIAAGKVSLSR